MSTDTRRYLGAIMLALAGLVLWFGAIPSWNSWQETKTAITTRETALAERQRGVAKRANILQTYNQRQADVQQLALLIPVKRSEPEMIVAIESIAQTSGVIVDNLSVSSTKDARTIPATMTIAIQARGNYAALQGFIGDLERNIRLIDIQSVAMNPGEGGIVTLNLNAVAYFLNSQASKP